MCTPPSLLRPGGHRATRLYLNLGVVHHRQHLQGEGLGIYNFMSRSVIVIVIIVILVILIPLWTLFPIRFRQSIWNIRIIYIYVCVYKNINIVCLKASEGICPMIFGSMFLKALQLSSRNHKVMINHLGDSVKK